jgi:hypothetical protein
MSYKNLIDLYLVDNVDFSDRVSNFSDYIKRKEDLCFISYYNDWLTDRFADIIKRSQTQYEGFRFLSYYPLDEEGIYFIVEPMEVDKFGFQLDYLMDWVIQDDYCARDCNHKYEMLDMINNVSFESYDIWGMYETWLYPYYCLLALRSMIFFASKNDKFVIAHVWVGG